MFVWLFFFCMVSSAFSSDSEAVDVPKYRREYRVKEFSSNNTFFEKLFANFGEQHFSLVGHGANAQETHLFLDQYFTKLEGWKRRKSVLSFPEFRCECIYFKRKIDDVTHIAMLPFQTSFEEGFRQHSLDEFLEISQFTKSFMVKIYKSYKTLCSQFHFIGVEAIDDHKFQRYSSLSSCKHANYVSVVATEQGWRINLYEPLSLQDLKEDYADPVGDKMKGYLMRGISLPISCTVLYRGDQVNDEVNCVRFSLVYMLFDVSGCDLANLSHHDIGQGFERWIDSYDSLTSRRVTSGKGSFWHSWVASARYWLSFVTDCPPAYGV